MSATFGNFRDVFLNANSPIMDGDFSIDADISTGERDISLARGSSYSYRDYSFTNYII